MARTSTARRLEEPQAAVEQRRPAFGGGDPPVQSSAPVVNNARLGVLMFLGAEAMFFAGLIGAFLVFRLSSSVWPPPFQPRLPVGITGVNTVILLLSAFPMLLSLKAARAGHIERMPRLLATTAALGAIFLAIQGYEWLRLIHFGLTVSSSVYGGLFYTLIGFHGIHVVGALIWLFVVWAKARRRRFSKFEYTGLATCTMYWTFVVALWPILYGLVYLY
jgi:cytochrome c oxidase subunit III